jgi:two-component system alkaline phosphatase synthesis response regulator PhoP
MKKVLLIEDDANLAFMTIDGLESEGFEVQHLTKGEEVMDNITKFQPDIVLLDVNLKGAINGFEVSKKIRQTSRVPIIFTTSRTQIDDVQEGFKIGNVDYLKKPFGIRELILRINELLSRNTETNDSEKTYLIGNFLFSPTEHSLQMYEEKNHLQKNECSVLTLLCENKGKVLTKKIILETVWNDEDLKQKEASLNNIISSLRNKLSKDNQIEIQTIPKIGYRLVVKEVAAGL